MKNISVKKRVGCISAGAETLSWLAERLKTASPAMEETQELIQAVHDLMNGEIQMLMIEERRADSVPNSSEMVFGDLHIFPLARRVKKGERDVLLTPKEFDILLFLAKNRGEVFTKEQIYQAVWDNDYLMDDSNIMAFIRKLRKKIETHPDTPEYIVTIWGIGYKFSDVV